MRDAAPDDPARRVVADQGSAPHAPHRARTAHAAALSLTKASACRAPSGTLAALTTRTTLAILSTLPLRPLHHRRRTLRTRHTLRTRRTLRTRPLAALAALPTPAPPSQVIAALGRSEAAAARTEWELGTVKKFAGATSRVSTCEAEAEAMAARGGAAQTDQEGRLKMMEVLAGLRQ